MIKLNLKKHRIKNKLTQDELAIKSKVSQTYISRLENNNFRYRGSNERDKFIEICKNLKTCPSEIIQYNCNNCVIMPTKELRKTCRKNHINKGCSHMFLLEE